MRCVKPKNRVRAKKTGKRGFLFPVRSEWKDYWRATNFSHATSVPGSAPPAGSKRTTPDSSEQKVRWPVVPTVTGTAEASNEVFGLAAVPPPPAPVAFNL